MNLLNYFKKEIILTEDETKIEEIIDSLLEKADTDIQEDFYSRSYMLSNTRLDSYVEVNGSISVASKDTSISRQVRLSVIEHFKERIQKEASARYKATKEITFKKTLSLLDSMSKHLKE